MVYLVEICDNIQHDTPVIGAWTGGELWREEYGPFKNKDSALAELSTKMTLRLQQGYSLCTFSLYNYSNRNRIEYWLKKDGETLMYKKIENLGDIIRES